MAENVNENLTTLQKVTRSLSVKIGGSAKEHVGRNGAKKSLPAPKKLEADSWIQGGKPKPLVQRDGPPCNLKSMNSVGDKASIWSKFADGHREKQALNPFSDTYDKEKLKSLICSKDDPNYGKPDKNSASAMRAAAGEAKMRGDICDVCEVIFNSGQRSEDGCAAIQFGELFEIYNRINDKVVGLLIRARKKDLLSFEGEMLYQGKDDLTWIVLTKNINTIRVFFGRDGDLAAGGVAEGRRGSAGSTVSLPAARSAPMVPSAASSAARLQVPGHNDEVKEAGTEAPTQSPATTTENNKSKLSNKGLRSSFRKLVRPIFKRSNSTKDKEDEDTDTPPGSRRGSWLSSKSSSRIEVSKVGEGELQEADSSSAGNDNKEEVQKRWKRVLSVSKAVGRFSVLSKQNNDELESISGYPDC